MITQEMVNEELGNAIANGVDFVANGMTSAQITDDMLDCCPAVEGMEHEELLPYVDAWRTARLS